MYSLAGICKEIDRVLRRNTVRRVEANGSEVGWEWMLFVSTPAARTLSRLGRSSLAWIRFLTSPLCVHPFVHQKKHRFIEASLVELLENLDVSMPLILKQQSSLRSQVLLSGIFMRVGLGMMYTSPESLCTRYKADATSQGSELSRT